MSVIKKTVTSRVFPEKPAVFLDRDGTINREVSYLHRIQDFAFEENACQGIRRMKEKGYQIIIVTNQSGIGRGIYTQKDVEILHAYMKEELKKKGVTVDGIYLCPHTPEENCNCRKPGTALYEQAAREHRINLALSWMVGDRLRDIEAAKKLGSRGALVRTGYFSEEEKASKVPSFAHLLELAEWLPEVWLELAEFRRKKE